MKFRNKLNFIKYYTNSDNSTFNNYLLFDLDRMF